MKKHIGTILVTLMGLGLLIYTASRTLSLIETTLPADKQILGYIALAAFDGGLVIWTLVYLYGASGGLQRAISSLMIIVSLFGSVVAFVTDTFVQAGKNGIIGRADTSLVSIAIWVTAAIIAINVAAVTAFHVLDPERLKHAAEEEAHALIEEETIKQIRTNAATIASQIAAARAQHWVAQTTHRNLSGLGPGYYQQPQPLPAPAPIETLPVAPSVSRNETPSVTSKPAATFAFQMPRVLSFTKRETQPARPTSAADSAAPEDETPDPK